MAVRLDHLLGRESEGVEILDEKSSVVCILDACGFQQIQIHQLLQFARQFAARSGHMAARGMRALANALRVLGGSIECAGRGCC